MSKTIRATLAATLAALPGLAQAAADHAEQSGGMPQLAFGNPMTIAQVVWMLIIFGLLYYVMVRYALPQVEGVLEARRARIEGDLDTARAAKNRADSALAELRAASAKARAEAQAAVATATQQANAEAQAHADALSARLTAQIEAADARIAASRDAAMGALRQVATDTTESVITRLLGTSERGAAERAVDMELATRGQA